MRIAIPVLHLRATITLGMWALPFALGRDGDGAMFGVLCLWFTVTKE